MARPFTRIAKEVLQFLNTGPKPTGYRGKSPYPFLFANELRELVGDNDGFHEIEQRRKLSQVFWNLKKNRLVIIKQRADGTFVAELTEKGKRKVKEFHFVDLKIPIPKKWDGKWRIIIFDIPNKRTAGREALRNKLKALDFSQLQKSVWVFPYPCEAEIEFIVELFKLFPYVQIIEATYIKNDVALRKYYRLF